LALARGVQTRTCMTVSNIVVFAHGPTGAPGLLTAAVCALTSILLVVPPSRAAEGDDIPRPPPPDAPRPQAPAAAAPPQTSAAADPSAIDPVTVTPARSRPAWAVQGGISGLTYTAEAELATTWGLIGGAGVHGGRYAPAAATARLAYDYRFSDHWHVRAGVRLYAFSESPSSPTCKSCELLVPEIGLRFVGASGFVFELGEPLGRLNLNQVPSSGVSGAFASDEANGFLVSLLVGYSHPF